MNQNAKLKGRDFIYLGIFTVIFIILFMIFMGLMSTTIYTQPFGTALGALIAGSVYMLLRAKTPKPWAITVFGVLYGLVMFVMGSGWPILLTTVAGTIIAELIARGGGYQSFKHEAIGYAFIMSGVAIGTYVPLLTMKDYYRQLAESNSIDNEFMAELVNSINIPYLAFAIVTTFIAAIIGAFVARALFKKHFVKAGLLKKM